MAIQVTPTPNSKPFWDALAEGRISMQRCNACSAWVHFPRPRCPRCLSDELAWHDVALTGTVHTFSIARQPTNAAFDRAGELVIAIVALDDGPKVTTNVVGVPPDDVTVGMRVTAVFTADGDTTLLQFEPLPG